MVLALVAAAFGFAATGVAAADGDVKAACLAFIGGAFAVIVAVWRKGA